MFGCARRCVNGEEADRSHVVVKHPHLLGGELSEVHAPLTCDPKDVVVDIGDVADAPHANARRTKPAMQDVEDVVDEGVAEVRRVVGRDAADVDADPSAQRLEGHHLPASGVEQLHSARFYGALERVPSGGSGSRALRAASRISTLLLKLTRALAASNPSHTASAISAGSGFSSASAGASTMK